MDRGLSTLQRLTAGAVCLLLGVALLAVPGIRDAPAQHRAPQALLSPGIASTTPLSQLLGQRFTLPIRERSMPVAKALTADLDADGDVDAIATTTTGKILVWINVGRNRLERRMPIKTDPGQSRVGHPVAPTTDRLGLDAVDTRWFVQPSRNPADTPPPSSSPRSRSMDRSEATPQFSLPSRAPPTALASTL